MPNPSQLADDIVALEAKVDSSVTDIAALAARVTALENSPASAGAPGPAGPAGPQGPAGPAGTVTADTIVQALIDQIAKGITVAAGTAGGATSDGATGGGGGGGGTSSAGPAFTGQAVGSSTDQNVYPLPVPAVTDGSDIVIGTGPNTLEIQAASSPGAQSSPSTINLVFVRPDGTMQGLVADLPVTSFNGEGTPKQSIKVKGPWGSNPQFLVTPSAKGSGTNGLFIGSVSIDLAPMGIYGQLNSRGGDSVGTPTTYISNNGTAKLMLTINQPPVVAPPAPVLLEPVMVALTADLVGTGQTIDATGHRLVYDKAILVPTVTGLTVKDVVLTGARLNDQLGANGAGLRNADIGIDFTMDGVETHHCDNGILTFPANINLLNCTFHENGSASDTAPALTHNAYVGGNKDSKLTVRNYKGWGATRAHDIKSRAGTTDIDGINSTAGGQGRCIDVPDGGNVTVSNGTLTIPAGAADRTIYGFGTESGSNPGRETVFTNIQFVTSTDQPGQLLAGAFAPDAVLTLVNCTYKGPKPNLVGWATVNGDLTAAA